MNLKITDKNKREIAKEPRLNILGKLSDLIPTVVIQNLNFNYEKRINRISQIKFKKMLFSKS